VGRQPDSPKIQDSLGARGLSGFLLGASLPECSPEREQMHYELLLQFMAITTGAAGLLWIRDFATAPPALTAAGAVLICGVALLMAYVRRKWARRIGFAFYGALVLMIGRAALDLGGSTGSALVLACVPPLLASLTLGPGAGWAVCGLTLACFVGILSRGPIASQFDRLRFLDEIAMTVFTTALGHTLARSFDAYEAAIVRRRNALGELEARRVVMAQAIYEDLEPRVEKLVNAFDASSDGGASLTLVEKSVDSVAGALRRAKSLTKSEAIESLPQGDQDVSIRRDAMRLWLRLGAAFMGFIIVRNAAFGVAFAPSLLSFSACLLFDYWLGRPRSARHLEGTALAIGFIATIPLVAHIYGYGARADAPPLVVAPATVLFTSLLSRGGAAFVVVFLNLCILAWVGLGHTLTLPEYRRLGDLGLIFFAEALALRRVFALRAGYGETLRSQAELIAKAQRQYRRLAGTLFHDANNFLQALALYSLHHLERDVPSGRSLSRRVERLVRVSKGFLTGISPEVELQTLTIREAFVLLEEAFVPLMRAKDITFELRNSINDSFVCETNLLVESVLGNLVNNAVKFSAPGSAIVLGAERRGAEVCICVSDSGAGFTDEVLAAGDGDGALPSRTGTGGEIGQGYGLRLAREHLERMGGRLHVGNKEGGGAECLVFLKAANPGE
jgi:signal transduction histidine kinase